MLLTLHQDLLCQAGFPPSSLCRHLNHYDSHWPHSQDSWPQPGGGTSLIHSNTVSHILFVVPWIAACQAPLSIEFSWKEYWSGILKDSLLQGIFLTQGLNPGLPHCRQILYCLSHQSSPICRDIPSAMTHSHGGPGALPEIGTISVMQLTLRAPCRNSWAHILAHLLTLYSFLTLYFFLPFPSPATTPLRNHMNPWLPFCF